MPARFARCRSRDRGNTRIARWSACNTSCFPWRNRAGAYVVSRKVAQSIQRYPAVPDSRMNSAANKILRNSGWNLVGQALPLAAALIAIPALVRILGAERFGVLTLIWGLVGYFSMFDLGIGRALTKVISERLAKGTTDLADIVGTGLALAVGFGLLGTALLLGFAGVL